MINLENVAFSYGGGNLLSEVSLRLAPGSFHFLTGPSGAGKSTFLKLCYGELAATTGRVTLFDRDVTISASSADQPSLSLQLAGTGSVVATLAAARSVHDGRIVAVFQPHLFSRTRALAQEFGEALSSADIVVVTDIYAARETPEPGVDGTLVMSSISGPDEMMFVPLLADVPSVIVPDLRPGDLVITMGAGDITTLGPRILEALGG